MIKKITITAKTQLISTAPAAISFPAPMRLCRRGCIRSRMVSMEVFTSSVVRIKRYEKRSIIVSRSVRGE